MRKTLTLLVASTALTAVLGATAWSATDTPADRLSRTFTALIGEGIQTMPLILASDDDDDDDDLRRLGDRSGRDHDDDDDCDDDDDDDDDEDDDDCGTGAGTPAPAGTVAPPQNGLFGTGAPPRVQVN